MAALMVVGWLVWTLGVYQKEPSICLLVGAPFIVMELRQRWRPLTTIQKATVVAVAAIIVLPLLHMCYGILAEHGATSTVVYGTASPSSPTEWIYRLGESFLSQWHAIGTRLGAVGRFWQIATLAVPFLITWRWIGDRSVPWIPIGLALTALAVMVFQGLTLNEAPRYLIPVLALVSITLVLLIANAPSIVTWAATALVASAFVVSAYPTWALMTDYVAREQQGAALVNAVVGLNPENCPVYAAGLDVESSAALPILVALRDSPAGRCTANVAGTLLLGEATADGSVAEVLKSCARSGWRLSRTVGTSQIRVCRRFRSSITSSDGSEVSVRSVLVAHRILVPSSPF